MSQKDMAQQGSERINAFLEESKLNKAQAKKDEEARIFAQNHPDPTKEEEGLVDPLAMFTPLASDVVDVDRAIGSALEGDWGGAALGMVAAVPIVGDAAKAAIKASKKPNKVDAPVNLQKTISEYDATWAKFEEIDDVAEWQATVRKHVSEKRVDNPDVKTPELEESARQLSELKITREEHLANVDKYKPVREWTAVPREPSNKTIVFSLKDDQRTKGSFVFGSATAKSLGVQKSALSIGDNFNGRLDIPAYKAYDTWVVAGTSKGLGGTHYAKAIHYQGTDGGPVKFIASQKMGERIGKGEKEKTPYATVSGVIKDLDPDAIRKKADELLNDPEWTQVGFDPRRQGAFYVRGGENSGMAVLEADEVIQVGALLLAKKAVLDPTKKNFNQGGLVDAEMETLNFSHGGDVGEHPKTMAQEDRIEYVELGDNETLKSAALRVGISQNQLLKWNMTATDEQRKQKRFNIPNSYYEAGGTSKVQKIAPVPAESVESLTAKLNPKRAAYFEALKKKQAGVGTQVKEKLGDVGTGIVNATVAATSELPDVGGEVLDKFKEISSTIKSILFPTSKAVDETVVDETVVDETVVDESAPVVVQMNKMLEENKSEVKVDTTPSFEDGLFDWFSRSEGTVTATVNGVVTYPYGVEEGKFQGIDREAYKNEDGTYKDREFAIAVWGKHKIKLKENHPQWDSYPLGVREALSSYKWNYGLGKNVVAYAVAAAKEKDPVKQKALFKKSMTAMLDTFGATDKAKGEGVKGAMTGLVARRANDYNRAAKDLGYPKIAMYSLSNQKDGTGAVAVYKDKDGTEISTQKSSYKIHTDSKSAKDRKTNKSIVSVDLTNWSEAIT